MIKTTTFILCLMSMTLAQAQSVNIDEFKSKFFLSEYLLTWQPSKEVIAQNVPVGYQLDSLKSYGYYFTDRESRPAAIHMDYYNKQMIDILFFESKERYQSLIDFMKNEKNYKMNNHIPGGEFFSNGTIAITFLVDDLVTVNILVNAR